MGGPMPGLRRGFACRMNLQREGVAVPAVTPAEVLDRWLTVRRFGAALGIEARERVEAALEAGRLELLPGGGFNLRLHRAVSSAGRVIEVLRVREPSPQIIRSVQRADPLALIAAATGHTRNAIAQVGMRDSNVILALLNLCLIERSPR